MEEEPRPVPDDEITQGYLPAKPGLLTSLYEVINLEKNPELYSKRREELRGLIGLSPEELAEKERELRVIYSGSDPLNNSK